MEEEEDAVGAALMCATAAGPWLHADGRMVISGFL